jgi:hypothetical protein
LEGSGELRWGVELTPAGLGYPCRTASRFSFSRRPPSIDVRGKDVGEVELLSIKAASLDSGLSLHSALRQFHPELDADETGDCIVRVELGNDKRTLEVFAAIDDFVAGRASRNAVRPMSVASDERAGRQQG